MAEDREFSYWLIAHAFFGLLLVYRPTEITRFLDYFRIGDNTLTIKDLECTAVYDDRKARAQLFEIQINSGAAMSLCIRSVAMGILVTALLVSAAIVAGQASSLAGLGGIATYLLTPGIVLGFAVGSGHVHDTSFWVLTAALNALIYSLLAAPLIFVLGKFRSRFSSRSVGQRL